MKNSESEGLSKLTEYLAQTRRQAEISIDLLNNKIVELEQENDYKLGRINELTGERDYFKKYSEQLKSENSKKWKLQERDDWKSLVESVQKDRARLQDECTRLESSLDEAKVQIQGLQDELCESMRIIEALELERQVNKIPTILTYSY